MRSLLTECIYSILRRNVRLYLFLIKFIGVILVNKIIWVSSVQFYDKHTQNKGE